MLSFGNFTRSGELERLPPRLIERALRVLVMLLEPLGLGLLLTSPFRTLPKKFFDGLSKAFEPRLL